MKVCIYGAGAVGCTLAGRLHRGGAEVSVVARGANLAAIRAKGITVETPSRRWQSPVRVSDEPGTLGPQDAVIVAVKAPALGAIAPGLAQLLGRDTPVAFVMNGIPWWYFAHHGGPMDGRRLPKIDPGDAMWTTVGPDRALGGVILASCDLVAPGEVHVETPKSTLYLGEPAGGTARAEALAALLRDDDFTVNATADIRQAIWAKLQMNLCSGLFGCLSNGAPSATFHIPAVADAVRKVAPASAAMGHPTQFDAEANIARATKQRHRSSIVQDLDAGRPMEFHPTFGTPQEFGQAMGVPTPTMDLLIALVEARARAAGAFPLNDAAGAYPEGTPA
ncbi:MAG: 2-dehydropantoate 2-reductase [Acetobacteraceae bacterium]|nr:MAG: 2-dehydropantoate 2-reductase [Acetobacteraceae bacterium]